MKPAPKPHPWRTYARQPRDPVTGDHIEYERVTTPEVNLEPPGLGGFVDWTALDSDDRWTNE